MILYFADRNLNIQATASTNLPEGLRIISDTKTDEIETGTKTFNCELVGVDNDVIDNCQVGNFLLRSADDGDEFYTIIETEFDAVAGQLSIYAEDAGLDLLNIQVPEYEVTADHNMAWYVNYYITTYAPEWEIGLNESPSSTKKLKWDSEATLTERLLSIATEFNSEIAFSYEVEGLVVTAKYIDIYEERGNGQAEINLYIDKEVRNINHKRSIATLATALEATGATPKGAKKPINLSGANYSSDGETVHSPAVASDDFQIVGKRVISKSAMLAWSSSLDPDGLLVRAYKYETADKRELFSRTVTELKNVMNGETSFEVEFYKIPDDVRIGDRVNIVDDQDEIYVEARVLKLEISVTSGTQKAELGDYVIKSSGISEALTQLAQEVRNRALSTAVIIPTSSEGETFTDRAVNTVITITVVYGENIITDQTALEDIFGDSAALVWYKDGTQISTTTTHVISDNGFTLTLIDENINGAANYEARLTV